MDTKHSSLKHTLYWLEEIIIGLDLCPFARVPYQKGLVRIVETNSTEINNQLSFFIDELEHLQQALSTENATTLIVFCEDKSNFLDFNDFVGACEEILAESELAEHFQLAVFHPGFYFDNTDPENQSNWVGRSPYPTIHILRNADIETALLNHPDLKSIPIRNEKLLLGLSKEQLESKFYYLAKTV